MILFLNNSIRLRAHTSYGWSEYSQCLTLTTLPALPIMIDSPKATIHQTDVLVKNPPPFSVACHLTWLPAQPNGSSIKQYLIQVKHTMDYSQQLTWITPQDSKESLSLQPGSRFHLNSDKSILGWICEVSDDRTRVLIDGEQGFKWIDPSSITLMSMPTQIPKASYCIPIKDWLDHYPYNSDIHNRGKEVWSTIQTTDQLETTV